VIAKNTCCAAAAGAVATIIFVAALGIGAQAQAEDQPVATGGSPDGKVRIEVLSLKRTEGDTTTLRFAIVNDGNAEFSPVLANLRLLDLVSRRSYEPGLSSSNCRGAPGTRTVCWAMFAAPPPNTKTLTVKFYENIDLISGVPISQ
jgi:hypothetical protein